jgi:predicted HTH domain antitoxin
MGNELSTSNSFFVLSIPIVTGIDFTPRFLSFHVSLNKIVFWSANTCLVESITESYLNSWCITISMAIDTRVKEEIKVLTKGGYYPNESELLEDAFRALLEKKPELKISTAVERYKKGNISLNRVAKLAGVTTEEFKEILSGRGIKIRRGTGENLKKASIRLAKSR